ncbi:MAG: acyltransferase family protein [Gammaproteobacteria bacterium]
MNQRVHFIDWMKAVGMLLIVIGHVIGSPDSLFNAVSAPLYTKQLGVAFFIFIIGWSLANENRAPIRVVYNRIFPVYFYGILAAMLLSLIFLFTKGDINESNYLPFFFGVNVFANAFPANTTTWYIGLYLHVLLFWYFVTQQQTITLKHLAFSLIAEIVIRWLLMSLDRPFTAYMILPNWVTVFLLGSYLKTHRDAPWQTRHTFLVFAWIMALLLWAGLRSAPHFNGKFPFRQSTDISLICQSALISLMYLLNTFLFFEIARRLPLPKIVAFFARNTLIIFIAHIPIIFELAGWFYPFFNDGDVKRVLLIVLLYVGLGVASEYIQRVVPLVTLREWIWDKLENSVLPTQLIRSQQTPKTHVKQPEHTPKRPTDPPQ